MAQGLCGGDGVQAKGVPLPREVCAEVMGSPDGVPQRSVQRGQGTPKEDPCLCREAKVHAWGAPGALCKEAKVPPRRTPVCAEAMEYPSKDTRPQ